MVLVASMDIASGYAPGASKSPGHPLSPEQAAVPSGTGVTSPDSDAGANSMMLKKLSNAWVGIAIVFGMPCVTLMIGCDVVVGDFVPFVGSMMMLIV
jgi:hypothetical protein